MRAYTLNLPDEIGDVLEDAAARAGLAPDELLGEGLRAMPEFQLALEHSTLAFAISLSQEKR